MRKSFFVKVDLVKIESQREREMPAVVIKPMNVRDGMNRHITPLPNLVPTNLQGQRAATIKKRHPRYWSELQIRTF